MKPINEMKTKETPTEWLLKRLETFSLIKEGETENEVFRQLELEAKQIENKTFEDFEDDLKLAFNMGKSTAYENAEEFIKDFKPKHKYKIPKQKIIGECYPKGSGIYMTVSEE